MRAQNIGIRIAESDYVTFVDSDDWVEDKYFERFMKEITNNNFDAIISNSICIEKEEESVIQYSILDEGIYEKSDIECRIIPRIVRDEIEVKPTIFAYLPGKIFKRQILISIMDRMDLEIRLGQDGAITFPYVLNCKQMKIVNNSGYHYVQRSESVSHNPNFNYFQELYKLQKFLQLEKIRYTAERYLDDQFELYLRDLLILTIDKIYGIELGRILCIPPYEKLNQGERVVVYGAGKAGRTFVKQLLISEYVQIVGWIDQKVTDLIFGIKVEHPEKIKNIEFDRVLLAITDQRIVREVRDTLINMNIPEEKIVYKSIYWG